MPGYRRPEDDVPENQTIRKFPVLHNIGKQRRSELESFLRQYMSFLEPVKTSMDVADEVIRQSQLKTHKFYHGIHEKRNCFLVDKEGTNFAIIKYGRKALEYGLRLMFVHNDSPCLIVKSRPSQFEWDPELKELYTGARLNTNPYGGIHSYQWSGHNVLVTGWTVRKNFSIKRLKPLPAYIPDKSPHLNSAYRQDSATLNDAFSNESLDVIMGNESKKNMRKHLKLNSEDDFAVSRLFVVPDNQPRMLDNYFISGFGQDDRCCVFAAMKALFKSNPDHTCILFGFDKEEVGSFGYSGAQGKFFDYVIEELAASESEQEHSEFPLSYRRNRILRNSIAINADTDIGSTLAEIDEVDKENVARMGYGPFICAHDGGMDDDQTSPMLVRKILNLTENPFKKKISRVKIRSQVVGSPHKADEVEGLSTMSVYFSNRGIPTINVGVPVGGLHSPAELINGGDLYWAYQLYQAFFQSNEDRVT